MSDSPLFGVLPDYIVGLDLGKMADFTARAILRRWPVMDERGVILKDEHHRDVRRFEVVDLYRYQLGTSYPTIVANEQAILARPQLQPVKNPVHWLDAPQREPPALVVDATGVGRPVVDMLSGVPLAGTLIPISITGGMTVGAKGGTRTVPKADLVSAIQVLLQSGRLKIAEGMEHRETLRNEFTNFQVKVTDSANEQFGAWRTGAHDDLVLAVALACWVGLNRPRGLKDWRNVKLAGHQEVRW